MSRTRGSRHGARETSTSAARRSPCGGNADAEGDRQPDRDQPARGTLVAPMATRTASSIPPSRVGSPFIGSHTAPKRRTSQHGVCSRKRRGRAQSVEGESVLA
jgi:hypothetical protein